VAAHKNDCCFNCGARSEVHGNAKHKRKGTICTDWEFIPASSRSPKMIDFTVMFQSESSRKKYETIYWQYGDFSCNCPGWRTHRTCKHIQTIMSNMDHYRNADAAVQASSSSVVGTVAGLKAKMDAMEAAVKRGDAVELNKLQAEIELQQQMFEAAGQGLSERFAKVKANIHQSVYGDVLPVHDTKPAAETKLTSDDPFADPFADD